MWPEYERYERVDLSNLVGKTIVSIEGLEQDSKEVRINTECGRKYAFYHEQQCCENVELNDFECDVEDLIGAVVLSAEISTNKDSQSLLGAVNKDRPNEYSESWTWSFYKIETSKGELWIRWLGESNGFYSEEVNFARVKDRKLSFQR